MIEIYSKDNCPWCVKAKEFLSSQNLPFTEFVLGTHFTKQEFQERFGNEVKTVPQILFDGRRIGGYDDLVKFFAKKEI